MVYDEALNRNVPLPNAIVTFKGLIFENGRVTQGMWYYDVPTYSDGSFSMHTQIPASEADNLGYVSASFAISYEDSKGHFKITDDINTFSKATRVNVTFPVGRNWVHEGDPTIVVNDGSNRQLCEIHRAADYFFNVQTDIPAPNMSDRIRIIANNTPNGSMSTGYIGGVFTYFPNGNANPFIEIWNNGFPVASTIGTALHELGHFTHYRNNNSIYAETPRFLKESLSSYVGWYLAHEYYRSSGLTIYPDQDITAHGLFGGQGRQTWDKTSPDLYTPLLVDLADDMNQRGYYGYFNPLDFPNDNIKNIPPAVVWSIITYSQDWIQYRAKIQSYAGTGMGKYHTSAQFNEWITAYDGWLATYPQYLTFK